mgnify:CR=1 FL=1
MHHEKFVKKMNAVSKVMVGDHEVRHSLDTKSPDRI